MELGDRLMPAFDTPSGIPLSWVNLHKVSDRLVGEWMGGGGGGEGVQRQFGLKTWVPVRSGTFFDVFKLCIDRSRSAVGVSVDINRLYYPHLDVQSSTPTRVGVA